MATLKNLMTFSALLASATAFAETYYFTNYERNVAGTNNSWYTSDAWTNSSGVVTANVSPKSGDTAVFSNEYLQYSGRDCVVNNGVTVKDIILTNGFGANLAQGTSSTLTITGDLKKLYGSGEKAGASTATFSYSGNTSHSFDTAAKLVIGGNVEVGEVDDAGKSTINAGTLRLGSNGDLSTSWSAGLGKVTIGGDVILRYRGQLQLNSAFDYDGTSYASVKELAWAKLNAGEVTVQIGGALLAYGGQSSTDTYWTNPDLILFSRRNTVQGGVAIIEANGINGTFNTITTSASCTTDSIAILRLVNDASSNYSTSSWIYDKSGVTIPDGSYNTKMMIQMAGVGTQKLAGDRLCITGGIDILSGTLQVNMSNATEGMRYSRGDITLRGGKFGSLLGGEKNKGQSNMLFSDFIYTDGTWLLYTVANNIDKLTLEGSLLKGESFAPDGKMKIDISGDAAWLIDNFAQILVWDNTTKLTDFDAGEISANTIEVDGKIYSAVFDIRDDGLWVSYTSAVPEPAAIATLLGILALGFVAVRRRK